MDALDVAVIRSREIAEDVAQVSFREIGRCVHTSNYSVRSCIAVQMTILSYAGIVVTDTLQSEGSFRWYDAWLQ